MSQFVFVNLLGMLAAGLGFWVAIKLKRRLRLLNLDPIEADPTAEMGSSFWRQSVSPLARALRPSDQDDLEELQLKLMCAARRNRDAVDRYLEERAVFLLGSMIVILFVLSSMEGGGAFILFMLAIAIGWRAPAWFLARRARERREAIEVSLPSGLDLLMTCMRAGLSLEKSLLQVANNVQSAYPVFAEELHLTTREVDAGVPLSDALRRLANRVGLDELTSTCSVLAQAHALGAPVGDTLEQHAESSRRTRMAGLEERAGKAAATLTVPLAVFFLPSGLIVILGPAVIILSRVMQ